MKISVMLNSFPYELEPSIEVAAGLGLDAVQIPLTLADDRAFRARLVKETAANSIAISATAVNLGDWGEGETFEARVEAAKPLIAVTGEMGTRICQTHIGIVPYNSSGPRWDSFVKTAEILGEYAEQHDVCIAIETGPEPPRVLEKLLLTAGSPALGINYDPANLLIWPAALANFPDRRKNTELAQDAVISDIDFEPIEGVKRLAPYIVHTHAKDAHGDGGWDDVPLGQGRIDWQLYLKFLQSINFEGYLAIERETGDDRIRDIGDAVSFLRGHLTRIAACPMAVI